MNFHRSRPRRRARCTSPVVNNALRLCADAAQLYLQMSRASARPRSAPTTAASSATAPSHSRPRLMLLVVPALALVLIVPLVQPNANSAPVTRVEWQPEQSATIEAAVHQAVAPTSGACRDGDALLPTVSGECQLYQFAEEMAGEASLLPIGEEPELMEEVVDAEPSAPEPVAATTVSAGGLSWPALGRITSVLGPAHPMGIDIALDAGQPVYSAGDGRVAFAGWSDDYGNFALINLPGGYVTRFAHLIRPASVRTGEQVRRGQAIGFAGSTGKSDGPHLHFEVQLGNLLVDPLKHLPRIPLVYDLTAYRAPSPSTTPVPTPTPVAATLAHTAATPESTPSTTAIVTTPAPAATRTNLPSLTSATPAPATTRTPTATVVVLVQTPSSTPMPVATPTPTPTPIPATPPPTPTAAPTTPPAPAASGDGPSGARPPD